MLYTVIELSELIGLSKQSTYKKLKAKEIQEHVTKKQGITYVDEIAFALIKDSLKVNIDFKNYKENTILNKEISAVTDDTLALNKEMFNLLTEQLKASYDNLKTSHEQLQASYEQLNQKDLQIGEKDLQIKELIKIIENSQVLLKDKPKQDIFMLEEHFTNLDTKLEEVKENMLHRKEKQIHTKGFLSNLFNRK